MRSFLRFSSCTVDVRKVSLSVLVRLCLWNGDWSQHTRSENSLRWERPQAAVGSLIQRPILHGRFSLDCIRDFDGNQRIRSCLILITCREKEHLPFRPPFPCRPHVVLPQSRYLQVILRVGHFQFPAWLWSCEDDNVSVACLCFTGNGTDRFLGSKSLTLPPFAWILWYFCMVALVNCKELGENGSTLYSCKASFQESIRAESSQTSSWLRSSWFPPILRTRGV